MQSVRATLVIPGGQIVIYMHKENLDTDQFAEVVNAVVDALPSIGIDQKKNDTPNDAQYHKILLDAHFAHMGIK